MDAITRLYDAPETLVVCVLGLGYVGLPLAVAFSKHHAVIGFDIDPTRIEDLQDGTDPMGIYTPGELAPICFTGNLGLYGAPDVFIVAVPTDIDAAKQPDLGPFRRAAQIIAERIKPGGLVIVESTVYPGATREVLAPVIAKGSGLLLEAPGGFSLGYSPERIVPGRPTGVINGEGHTLRNTVKIVSGASVATGEAVRVLYSRIVDKLHVAPTIEVAEAAKILENTQRDVNIALVNEFSMICERLGVDTQDVIDAAATKWNFHAYRPGLVGGHCIGVDPFYMAYQAARHGFHANVILAGRQINDRMGTYVARQTMKLMMAKGPSPRRVLILGAAFKEDCDDLRNSRVPDIIAELRDFSVDVDIHDPLTYLIPGTAHHGAMVTYASALPYHPYDAIILAVPHGIFQTQAYLDIITGACDFGAVLIDVKGIHRHRGFPRGAYWHL